MVHRLGRLSGALVLVAALSGCEDGGAKQGKTSTAAAKTAATAKATATATASATATAKAVELAPGAFHFEFPIVEKIDAKKGQEIFYVNMKILRNELAKGEEPGGTQMLIGTMVEPGEKESVVEGVGNVTIPNAGIVPIPPGEEAKVGDVVVGKWAVNMTRGYVTDATDPKKPKVIFIGIDYDNPAKAEDEKTGIGQYEYQLDENQFMVISEPYDPGTACVYEDGGRHKLFEVWRAEGDWLIGEAFTKFRPIKKADCKPIPIKPDYQVGDEVYVPFVGSMTKAKITKVGKGRYGVKRDGKDEEEMVSFGEVIDELE